MIFQFKTYCVFKLLKLKEIVENKIKIHVRLFNGCNLLPEEGVMF